MPWTRDDVCDFTKLSDAALRRVEAQTAPVPVVPLPGRGTATLDRYDEDEVRAWWAARVADARAGRLTQRAGTSTPPRRGRAPIRVPVPDREAAA